MRHVLPLFLVLAFTLAGRAQTVEKIVEIPQPQAGASRYFYVPFDVPAGVRSVRIGYEYDSKDGSNVLDLGLFDGRFGGSASMRGFRGWSGGRRREVFVSAGSATNGYVPGAIEAGTWRVILGLYKIVPEGVKVRVKVTFDTPDSLENETDAGTHFPPASPTRARDNGPRWYRGDLHMHTFHSDGTWTAEGLAKYADAVGLDFVAVTDHNTLSHHTDVEKASKLYPNLLVMRGEEVTTYGGHFNVWGLRRGSIVDFRVTPGNREELRRSLSGVEQAGAVASMNHPNALCGGCSWSYGDDLTGLSSIEVWNGRWDPTDDSALRRWDELLKTGKRITAIGSSDSHAPPTSAADPKATPIGTPTTVVFAERLTENAILNSIKTGRVTIAASPEINLELASGKSIIGDEVRFGSGEPVTFRVAAKGLPEGSSIFIVTAKGKEREFKTGSGPFAETFQMQLESDGYVRVEARDAAGQMLAFTNPIYVRRTK